MYEITFENIRVVPGSANWARALLAAKIDFQSNHNVFYFGVNDPDLETGAQGYRIGRVELDTRYLITLIQQSAIGELSLMAESQVDLEPSGVYDCQTAQYMGIIAAYLRGTPVQHKAFSVGPEEVFFLLARNTFFQVSVNDALKKAGYADVSGQNGIPLIYRDWATFTPPKIPADCGFAAEDIGGGVESGPPEGFEDVAYSTEPASKFPTVMVGAAVGAAAALIGSAVLVGKRRR